MSKMDVKTASSWIKNADALLITASNGFSISEGLNLFSNDEQLKEVLGDLADTYSLTSLISAMGFPYKDRLDYWRVVSRIVEHYGHNYQVSSFMKDLKEFVGKKPYFIWTSNVDHHFSLAGFENVFEIEGNWFEGTCSTDTDNHGVVSLAEKLHDIFLKDQRGTLSELDIPRCNECGTEISLNLAGDNFQMNQNQLTAFQNFITTYENKKLVILELGIGAQNQLIKAPTMQLVAANKNSRYITINQGELFIPEVIADRTIGFSSTIQAAFKELKANKSFGAPTQGPGQVPRESAVNSSEEETSEKAIQKFYPHYMLDQRFYPNVLPMYLTIDKTHPSYLHATQYGRSFMYAMGGSALVHCFTPQGQYYTVQLGLDKSQGEVHGFYVEGGTFIGIESIDDSFSIINTDIPTNNSGEIFVPNYNELIKVFPEQRQIIEELIVSE